MHYLAAMAGIDSTQGILRPQLGFEHFELDRTAPPEDLRSLVTGLWTVHWNLPPGEVFEQQILPFPNVNLAFEAGNLNVHGPSQKRFVARLQGRGWVAGLRFRPAGFRPLSVLPMNEIVEQVRPASEALGFLSPQFPADASVARQELILHVRRAVARTSGAKEKLERDESESVSRLVEELETNRHLKTATDLARFAGVSVRTLHRLLQRYVGLSSKWIVRRARIQQAADRAARGQETNWTEVAHELGYHDQAHFTRDFKAQMGCTPSVFAQRCIEDRRASDPSQRKRDETLTH